MKDNKISKKKIRFQFGLTITLVILYVILGLDMLKKPERDNTYEIFAYRLVNGEYASLCDYFDVHRAADGSRSCDGPEYKAFVEFVEYYDNYIRFVICDEYDTHNNTDEHMEKKQEYIKKMEEIKGNSQYEENSPHYEYLYEYVKK